MSELHAPYIRAVAAALQDAGVHVADYFTYTSERGLMTAKMIVTPEPGADRDSARWLNWDAAFGWQVGPPGLRNGTVHRSDDVLPTPADLAAETRNTVNSGEGGTAGQSINALRLLDADDGFLTRLAAYPARPEDPEDAPGRRFVPPGDRANAIPGKGETRHLSSAARTAAIRIKSTEGISWLIAEAWQEDGQWKGLGLRIPARDVEDPAKWYEVRMADFERVPAARVLDWEPVPAWQTGARGMWGDVVLGLRDDKHAARTLAGFPAWAAFNGIDATAEAEQAARQMVLARFPGAADTIYTVDVPSISTYRLRVRGGGELEARQVAEAIYSIDLDPVDITDGAFVPDVEATVDPTCISVWGPASFVHATTVDGRDLDITQDPPAGIPRIPAGSVILDPHTVRILADELRNAHQAMDPDDGTNDDEHDVLVSLTEILADTLPAPALAEQPPELASSPAQEPAARPVPLETGTAPDTSPAPTRQPGHSKRGAARPGQHGTGHRRDGGRTL